MNKGKICAKICSFLAAKGKSIIVSVSFFVICYATVFGDSAFDTLQNDKKTQEQVNKSDMVSAVVIPISGVTSQENPDKDVSDEEAQDKVTADNETVDNETADTGTSDGTVSDDEVADNETPTFYHADKEARYKAYQKKYPKKSYEQVVIEVNIGIDRAFFTDAVEVTNPDDMLVLVNKFHYLSSNYEPEDLVLLPEEYATGELELRKVAADALDKLISKAKEDGYEINVVSAYRSYKTQERLYNNYVERSGTEEADSYSARPGYSEHQTGLAVDLQAGDYKYNDFAKTEESKYVEAHAHEYGFILRYQKGKRYITGYIPEAWHIRYVGKEAATIIYNEGLTYEEYCVKYR